MSFTTPSLDSLERKNFLLTHEQVDAPAESAKGMSTSKKIITLASTILFGGGLVTVAKSLAAGTAAIIAGGLTFGSPLVLLLIGTAAIAISLGLLTYTLCCKEKLAIIPEKILANNEISDTHLRKAQEAYRPITNAFSGTKLINLEILKKCVKELERIEDFDSETLAGLNRLITLSSDQPEPQQFHEADLYVTYTEKRKDTEEAAKIYSKNPTKENLQKWREAATQLTCAAEKFRSHTNFNKFTQENNVKPDFPFIGEQFEKIQKAELLTQSKE